MSKPDLSSLEKTVDSAFEARDGVNSSTRGEVRESVETTLDLLDKGQIRVAERQADGQWRVNQWMKKAVMMSIALRRKDSSTAFFIH